MWRIWKACSCKGWSWWGQHSPKCCHSAIRHWTLFQQPSRWQSVAQRLRGSGSLGRGGKTVQLACLHHQCPTKSWAHHWLLLPTLALFSASFPDHLANAFPCKPFTTHGMPNRCCNFVQFSRKAQSFRRFGWRVASLRRRRFYNALLGGKFAL